MSDAIPALDRALDFSDKVAIVTGGTKGVGRGIAQRFLEAGANVVVCGRNEPETLAQHDQRTAHFIAADVRKEEQVAAVVDYATKTFGRLDTLINNAGGAPPADTATASARFSEKILHLNLLAPLLFAQRANEVMQGQENGGTIVNIASVSGLRPSPSTAAYGAAKAGLVNLTQTLAVEWAPKVRTNAIVAGMIRTEQAHLYYGDEDGIAAVGKTVPLGRLGQPEDVGDACLYLASDLSRYVSGASLLLHGGGEVPAFWQASNAETKNK